MIAARHLLPYVWLSVAATAVAAPAATPSAGSPDPAAASPSCKEHVETGTARPVVSDAFPLKGIAGHALVLEVTVEHAAGDTVLPAGFSLQEESDEARFLGRSGFYVPHPDGGIGPSLEIVNDTKTIARIPFVALPREPGRTELTLPPVPIALARPSGSLVTVCTSPHAVTIEDPTANDPEARPKQNPRAARQLEEWTTAKYAALGALLAMVLAALLWLLLSRLRKRPRPAPPPPPARPPWEVAMEELFDLKNAALASQGRYAAHFERLSHIVRQYLGDRFGFDGLESTTQETLAMLREVAPRLAIAAEIEALLQKADLVKFAKLTPTEAECDLSLSRAEEIVHRTLPAPPVPAPAPSAPDEPRRAP